MVLAAALPSFLAGPLLAGPDELDGPILDQGIEVEDAGIDWMSGRDVSIGDVLFPSLHFRAATGGSTGDPREFRVGAHDPDGDGITVQGLELGMSLRLGDYIEGFASYHAFLDENDRIEGEWEEIFGKLVEIPGGFELRGGQYLVRYGQHNAQHLHSWNWVDQYLVSARFLGDHGLYQRGGEITWNLPTPFTSALIGALGSGRPHSHDHAHGGHGHGHDEALFEGEDALFGDDDLFFAGRYLVRHNITDFHQLSGGLSAVYGGNLYGRNTGVYGLDFEYLWRQNGLEPGGDYWRFRAELLYRSVEAQMTDHGHGHDDHGHDDHGHDDHGHDDHGHDDHGHDDHDEHGEDDHGEDDHDERERGDYDEFGFYAESAYGFLEHFEAAARFGYVSGIDDLGLDERYRVSAALTWFPTEARNILLRLQGNYDHSRDLGDAASVWVQVGFDWGAPEVR